MHFLKTAVPNEKKKRSHVCLLVVWEKHLFGARVFDNRWSLDPETSNIPRDPGAPSNWLVLSDEQMSKRWPFSLLNDEQMSNWVGVKHLPAKNGNET